ncbi:hypothetical protein ISF_08743 [Cordyceps fumosorosea ARSEF 2679]|uniref:AB hydrolase-1 domain-containing protein n=1 Tax=Cordyceps fumosorosea (strain ARSEF 2679) TaxID=1081104 RepID=A0A162MAJ0_CORFA|nr:hypothetical protein ISF_08743 [Cordyceps fumosorosea ARSEF 2679]OAA53390.1 hypothetical protein ISF_08743 [Cordyceps fumosorosea ARSEF 2679]
MSATNSDTCIHTTAGPIEAEVSGSGIPVLILHGSPGGIDAACSMSRFLDKDTFKVICLSRPGYLNTPLPPVHRSIDAEADLLAALLDALDIPRAGVLAWSGGGPAAYQLASRYPDRVACLVSIAALSSAWIAPPKAHMTERILFGTKLGDGLLRFLSSKSPKNVIAAALKGEGSLRGDELDALVEQVMADAAQRQLVLEIALTVNVGGRRKQGWQNDVANFAAIESLGLEQIQCPVLLIHGDADTDAPPSCSESAHARLPRSELVMMPRGTHLSFYAHPEASHVQERTRKFLEHAKA